MTQIQFISVIFQYKHFKGNNNIHFIESVHTSMSSSIFSVIFGGEPHQLSNLQKNNSVRSKKLVDK